MLRISQYKPARLKNDTGLVAQFSAPTKNGVIYQTIINTYTVGNDTTKYKYTEAWTVKKGNIMLSGKDYFVIPKSALVEGGSVHIIAKAWYENGFTVPRQGMEIGSKEMPWGILYGINNKHFRAKGKTLMRRVTGTWEAGSKKVTWKY